MSGPYTLVPTQPNKLIIDASAAATQGILYPQGKTARVTIVVQGTGTTSSGVVTIEEAYYDQTAGDPVYSGTWSTITTVNASSVTGGAQQIVHVMGTSAWAVRARISTIIGGGGTVSVWAWGN